MKVQIFLHYETSIINLNRESYRGIIKSLLYKYFFFSINQRSLTVAQIELTIYFILHVND